MSQQSGDGIDHKGYATDPEYVQLQNDRVDDLQWKIIRLQEDSSYWRNQTYRLAAAVIVAIILIVLLFSRDF